MSTRDTSLRKSFRTRASLAKSSMQHLSYEQRLALASKGKDACKAEVGKTDKAGFIHIR